MIGSWKYRNGLLVIAASMLSGCNNWPAPFVRPSVPASLTIPAAELPLPRGPQCGEIVAAYIEAAQMYYDLADRHRGLAKVCGGE